MPEGVDIPRVIKGQYSNDSFFKLVLQNPKHYKNMEIENGLIYMKQEGNTRVLTIPEGYFAGRSVRELVIAEAHTMLAHLGASKTLEYLREHVWWEDMTQDVKVYCQTCMNCKRSKPNNHKPYGLLNPLEVPSRPWESIGVDFVGPLPESKNRDAS